MTTIHVRYLKHYDTDDMQLSVETRDINTFEDHLTPRPLPNNMRDGGGLIGFIPLPRDRRRL